MNGKGSVRRPQSVSDEELAVNWKRAFSKRKPATGRRKRGERK